MKEDLLQKSKQETGQGQLFLNIEGKQFKWHEQYITGIAVKKVGGLPADAELYLAINDPWKDEPIGDQEKVDLARPGIEQFFIKKKLKYTIDGKEFESSKQYIKGFQIRKQGEVKEGYEIFLSIKGPWEDELVEDNDWVDLARPGIEQFCSKQIAIIIIVNGREKQWNKKEISFVEVVKLAYGTYDDKDTKVYTVAFEDGPKQNPEGSMLKNSTVFTKNKMIFHATATDKS